jgi:hypothetical protein
MRKVIFKSRGEKIRAEIPETWEEVTVKQFMSLELAENPIEILAGVMNVDLQFLQETRTDLSPVMVPLLELFNNKPPEFKAKASGFIFQGKKVTFPRDINNMMFGQVLQINQLLEEGVNKNLVKIAGIALQPVIDGEFKEENQERISRLFELLPILEVFPELFFFAQRLRKYLIFGKINYLE